MDLESQVVVKVARLTTDPAISKANKAYIEKTVQFLHAKNLNPRTILRWLECLEKFFAMLGKKDVEKATRDDIEAIVAKVNMTDYSEETKAKIKTIIKAFYKHFFGEDLYYPKTVAWIKTAIKRNRLLPESLLSEEEVLTLIDKTTNVRDAALISLLFDSGIRSGELLSMKKSSVDLSTEPAHIQVYGKTGPRTVPIIFSAPYLGRYIDNNCKSFKDDDYLWMNMAQSHIKGRLTQGGLARMLQRVATEAGVTKAINPHAFRKARATNYATKLSDQALKSIFGWGVSSKAMNHYIAIGGRALDNEIMRANGVIVERKEESKITIRQCQKCRYTNSASMSYCGRCGSAMDIGIAMNEEKNRHQLDTGSTYFCVLIDSVTLVGLVPFSVGSGGVKLQRALGGKVV